MVLPWSCILLLAIGPAVVLAQPALAAEKTPSAWIELSAAPGGLLLIQANARAGAQAAGAYSYALHLTATPPTGKAATIEQEGTTILRPLKSATLAIQRLRPSAGHSVEATLTLHDGIRIVARQALHFPADTLHRVSAVAARTQAGTDQRTPLPSVPGAAVRAQDLAASASEALEINGLIIDETRSKAARDFYGYFYAKWQAPESNEQYAITIREFPSRGRIARVSVDVNGTPVYQPVLQPRRDVLQAAAEQALAVVSNYLQQQKQLKVQLESEDHTGNGLF